MLPLSITASILLKMLDQTNFSHEYKAKVVSRHEAYNYFHLLDDCIHTWQPDKMSGMSPPFNVYIVYFYSAASIFLWTSMCIVVWCQKVSHLFSERCAFILGHIMRNHGGHFSEEGCCLIKCTECLTFYHVSASNLHCKGVLLSLGSETLILEAYSVNWH